MHWLGHWGIDWMGHNLYIYFPQVHPVQRWGVICETPCRPAAVQRWPSGLEEPAGLHRQPPQLWIQIVQGKGIEMSHRVHNANVCYQIWIVDANSCEKFHSLGGSPSALGIWIELLTFVSKGDTRGGEGIWLGCLPLEVVWHIQLQGDPGTK